MVMFEFEGYIDSLTLCHNTVWKDLDWLDLLKNFDPLKCFGCLSKINAPESRR